MRIPKLFKKAAAFVMAAVTALSVMPATTAFAAGDIGTISFSMTYDSGGNAMRYNSSANINGYTAGGTGKYKYRMSVDGETAFCIQPGAPLKTGNTLRRASSDAWNALSDSQRKAVGLALLYGYQGNRHSLTGSDDEKWLATQTLVWEFVTECRESTGTYHQTSSTIYSLHFGSNYANDGARAAYDQIVSLMANHNTIPSFMSGGENDITRELAYKDGKYTLTLNDSNGVLSDFSFASSDASVSVTRFGNMLTISSTRAIGGMVRITATKNGVPTVDSGAKMIAYGDPNLQDVVIGVENVGSVRAYLGGNEQSTHKYVSELLGKATIDTNTYGKSFGRSGNYSTNYQISGRELLTPDEVRMLDNRYALLFVRGERPVMDFKYDILKHPNVKLTTDGGQPPYLHGEPTQAVATLVFDSDIPKNATSVIAVSTSYELLSEQDLEEIYQI